MIRETLGSYKFFMRSNFRFNSSNMELGTIKVAGEDYLHPAISSSWSGENTIRDVALVEYLRCVTRPRSGHRVLDPEIEVVEKNAREEASVESSPGDYLPEDTELTTGIEKDFPETSPQKGVSYVKELITGLCFSRACVWGLNAMVLATQVYKTMDGATISLKTVKTSLAKASWLSRRWEPPAEVQPADIVLSPGYVPSPLPRINTFACIAHFETGISQFDPEDFHQTLAIASENSLYVTGKLLSDPFDTIAENDVRFIVGNVGRTGLCLLVAPVNPEIRSLGDEYNLANHAPYEEGKRGDSFHGTSLHLKFTDWILPLEVEGARTIDQDVHMIESVISVLDSGKWVADLDILCIDFTNLVRLVMPTKCSGHTKGNGDYDYTALDTWEELLDRPKGVGVFRARGNWAARLAAVSILSQQGQGHSIGVFGPNDICLECMETARAHARSGLVEYESALSSFCID